MQLQYRSGQRGNFIPYKKMLLVEGCKQYGDLGRIPVLNKYFVPATIAMPEKKKDQKEDEFKAALKAHDEENKLRLMQVHKMKNDRTGYYNFMLGTLSPSSLAEVSLASDWTDLSTSMDPLRLWRRVVVVHVGIGTPKQPIITRNVRAEYTNMKQEPTETVDAFRIRFEELIEFMKLLSMAEVASEEQVAMEVIGKLDAVRFSKLMIELENSISLKTNLYPKTVHEAMELAADWKVALPSAASSSQPPPSVHLIDGRQVYMASAADLIVDRDSGVVMAATATQKGTGDKSETAETSNNKKRKRQQMEKVDDDYVCIVCETQGVHKVKNCPYLEVAQAAAKKAKAAAEAAASEKAANLAWFDHARMLTSL